MDLDDAKAVRMSLGLKAVESGANLRVQYRRSTISNISFVSRKNHAVV